MSHYPLPRTIAWLFASLATVGLLQAKENEKPKVTPGEIQSRSYFFKEAKKKMPYSLFVPEGYDKKKKYPLMVALHGLWSNHWQMIRYPGLTNWPKSTATSWLPRWATIPAGGTEVAGNALASATRTTSGN